MYTLYVQTVCGRLLMEPVISKSRIHTYIEERCFESFVHTYVCILLLAISENCANMFVCVCVCVRVCMCK